MLYPKFHTYLFLLVLILFINSFSQSSKSATITVDYASKTELFEKTKILNVARGGHGINKDLTWMPKFYTNLVNIGVKEFRIDWLFSDYYYQVISKNSSGQLVYNFSRLDSIILPLLQKNIKPVMCMCYMTNALADSMQCPPKDYNLYKSAVKTYVKHYKDKGYSGLIWESHNEPEGFTILKADQTYTMYKHFASAVKEADPSAKVGGYGAVGLDWINYLGEFLDKFKDDKSKPPMDFFSFHQYGKIAFEYVPEVEKRFTDRGLKIPDLYITEWNNGWGNTAEEGSSGVIGGGYDTHKNASYVAMKFTKSFSYKNLKKIYYWNFADPNSDKKFCGESGLFTGDNHRKAAANTFDLFNRLHSQMVKSSITNNNVPDQRLNSIFTRDDQSKKVSGILSNFSSNKIVIDLNFQNLPSLQNNNSKIKVCQYLIDSTHGNYFHDFQRGLLSDPVGPSEIVSLTSDSTYPYNQSFNTKITLPKYGVMLISLDVYTPVTITNIKSNEFVNYNIQEVTTYDLFGRICKQSINTCNITKTSIEQNSRSSGVYINRINENNRIFLTIFQGE